MPQRRFDLEKEQKLFYSKYRKWDAILSTREFIYTVDLIGFSDCDMSFKTVTKGVRVVQRVGKDGQVNLDGAFFFSL